MIDYDFDKNYIDYPELHKINNGPKIIIFNLLNKLMRNSTKGDFTD